MEISKQRAMKRGILSQLREENQPLMTPTEPVGTDSAGNTDDDLLGLFEELTGDQSASINKKRRNRNRNNKRLAYIDKSSNESNEDDGSDEDGAILPIPMG
jgi:hypothetical protein